MNHLAYQELAREVLWLLLERDDLRAAIQDRIVAYQIYHLPPALELELPDQDRFAPFLNPLTRAVHAARLEAAILHIATHQERDGWVVASPRIEVRPQLAVGHDRFVVRPDYVGSANDSVLVADATTTATARAIPEHARQEALVRVELDGAPALTLARGDGMLAVSRGRLRPRVTIFGPDPTRDDGREVAFLFANAPLRVASADGAVRTVPPFTPVPITHDLEFSINKMRWKFWQRALHGTVQVMGVARDRRPAVRLALPGGKTHLWDRNRQSVLRIDGSGEEALSLADTGLDAALELVAGGADRVEVRACGDRELDLRWFDGQPLRVPPGSTVPVLGAHLRGLGRDAQVQVTLDGGIGPGDAPAPSLTVLRATRGDGFGGALPVVGSLGDGARGAGLDSLFGYEAPIASIFCDGQLLEAHTADDGQRVLALDFGREELAGPLVKLAIDGLGGVKVMTLHDRVELEMGGRKVEKGTWLQVDDLARLSLPRCSMRIEAQGRPRLTFGRPVLVRSLSADPNESWRVGGWRLSVTDEALLVSGRGRERLRIDQQDVHDDAPLEVPIELTLPARAEHRVELGGVLYRIVRNNPAHAALDVPSAKTTTTTANRAAAGRRGTRSSSATATASSWEPGP